MTQDPVARSDALDATLAQNPTVINLVRIVRQHKLILWILTILLVLISALSGVVTWFAFQAKEAARDANSATTQNRISCATANDARAAERSLWSYVLTFPPPPDETPAVRARRLRETAQFKAYVAKHFAPRNCARPTPLASFLLPAPQVTPSASMRASPQPSVVAVAPRLIPTSSQPSPPPPTHPASHRPSPTPSPSPSKSRFCVTPRICIPPIPKGMLTALIAFFGGWHDHRAAGTPRHRQVQPVIQWLG